MAKDLYTYGRDGLLRLLEAQATSDEDLQRKPHRAHTKHPCPPQPIRDTRPVFNRMQKK